MAGRNRLASEASPYLRQHADNPVDWYPWGDEAFAAAAERDVPILLSIGYSACHWCHVMAHESFEDDEVAEVMNRLLREREGRPGGAARRRRHLHGGDPGHDRARRLADDGGVHARRPSVLRRHLLPEASDAAECSASSSCASASTSSGTPSATSCSSRPTSSPARSAALRWSRPATTCRPPEDVDAAIDALLVGVRRGVGRAGGGAQVPPADGPGGPRVGGRPR